MKTTIDAVNEFKGDIRNAPYCSKESKLILVSNGTDSIWYKGELVVDDANYTPSVFSLVCTIEEFNKCVSDCSSAIIQKPIYTQAMKEAGELPSVGMECLVKLKYQDNSMWLSCFIIGLNKEKDFLVFDHKIRGIEQHNTINGAYEFQPLTPPIELIDGKAYQFSVTEESNKFNAVYCSERKQMCTTHSYFDIIHCENIQLLEVK